VKIISVKGTPVNLPFEAPYRYASGSTAAVTKTIVEVQTDEGLVGWGEAADGDTSALVEVLGERVVGLDPRDLNRCESVCCPPMTYNLWTNLLALRRAFGAIEIALWDIRGQSLGLPLYSLLGGAVRKAIPFTEYFSFRLARDGVGGEANPIDVARYCARMMEDFDSPTFEGKVATVDLSTELEMVSEVRRAIGDEAMLRLDANCGWSLSTAREALRRLEPFNIRCLEDPTQTFEEMAKLRQNFAIPFSTHNPDVQSAVRLGVPDFIVLNLVELGGIRRTVEFVQTCEAFGIGFWFHSGDSGIASAAYLHVTAAIEAIREPSQALFHWTTDDVIEGGPFWPKAGVCPVPEGPGLGVTVDRAALRRCHERYVEQGPFPSGDPTAPAHELGHLDLK
jgi:glucarate dehydratase